MSKISYHHYTWRLLFFKWQYIRHIVTSIYPSLLTIGTGTEWPRNELPLLASLHDAFVIAWPSSNAKWSNHWTPYTICLVVFSQVTGSDYILKCPSAVCPISEPLSGRHPTHRKLVVLLIPHFRLGKVAVYRRSSGFLMFNGMTALTPLHTDFRSIHNQPPLHHPPPPAGRKSNS